MQYACDAFKGRTWFRIETEAEAAAAIALLRRARAVAGQGQQRLAALGGGHLLQPGAAAVGGHHRVGVEALGRHQALAHLVTHLGQGHRARGPVLDHAGEEGEGQVCASFKDLRFLTPGRDRQPFIYGLCNAAGGWRLFEREAGGPRWIDPR